MVTTTELLEAAADRGIDVLDHPAGAFRVDMAHLRDAIRLVRDLNLVILGMDGLLQDGAAIVPLNDFIADFSEIVGSWNERVRDSSEAGSEVAAVWSREPSYVELTLDGLDE